MRVCRSCGTRGNVVNVIDVDEQQETKERMMPETDEELNMDLFLGMFQGHNSGGSKLWYAMI